MDKMEWIIVDDGTDKIEDLVAHIPQVKYYKYDEKMSLGKKRNLTNAFAKGDIIVYMDDDDYYPPSRVSHAVHMLKTTPKALCAGSSIVHIYFKHLNKIFQFGPYGANHATAATFAFKRELLNQTCFDENSCVAEERQFLKEYTVPFVQLTPSKSILVFSHIHNSFDKKELLGDTNANDKNMIYETDLLPEMLVNEPVLLQFFLTDIDVCLQNYDPGLPQHKPDVVQQISAKKEKKQKMQEDFANYQLLLHRAATRAADAARADAATEVRPSDQIAMLTLENRQLNDKVTYLEAKIKQLISDHIQLKQKLKA